MVNSLDSSELRGLESSWKTLSDAQLQQELGQYFSRGEMEKGQQLLDFINKKNNPSAVKSEHQTFAESYDKIKVEIAEIRKKSADARKSLTPNSPDYQKSVIDEGKAIQKAYEEFYEQDMKIYVSKVGSDINTLEREKDSQINDLKSQLSDVVSHGPKLKEYLSLKRRRLVSINSKIAELKADTDNYPKNVLIYLMGMTNQVFFGTRQGLKRNWIKMTWRWKTDDIQKNLAILEDKIQISDKDSAWTIGLKKQIQEHLFEAKKAYLDQQAQSLGLVA